MRSSSDVGYDQSRDAGCMYGDDVELSTTVNAKAILLCKMLMFIMEV